MRALQVKTKKLVFIQLNKPPMGKEMYCFIIEDEEMNRATIWADTEEEMKDIYFTEYYLKKGYSEAFSYYIAN